MNRVIKFRGWRPEGKEMISNCGVFPSTDHPPCHSISSDGIMVKPDCPHVTLMQFTGLCDKNGKEIYEGDIVRVTVSAPWDEQVPMDITGTVSFENGRWWFTGKETNDCDGDFDFEHPEIIGNIYENPELLRAGGEGQKGERA